MELAYYYLIPINLTNTQLETSLAACALPGILVDDGKVPSFPEKAHHAMDSRDPI